MISNFFYILWLISCTVLINIYLSTLGAEDFRKIIKNRWKKLGGEPSTLEQAWLIPQPGRNTWGDSREFNKVSLVSQGIGYRPEINTKSDAGIFGKHPNPN